MAGSLFDQMKSAGLIDKKREQKAKKAKKAQHHQARQKKKKGADVELSDAAKQVIQAEKEQAERALQLNLARQEEQRQKAKQAEIRQLILTNQLTDFKGETSYNFADGAQVKTLKVKKRIYHALVDNSIRIARFADGYSLVPDTAAEKIMQRDDTVLISIQQADTHIADEDKDYYAQFEIPDDLMW